MSEIDFALIAQQISAVITPFLPYLLKGAKVLGEKVIEGFGESAGEESWRKASQIWGRIQKHIEKQSEIKTNLEEVTKKHNDPRLETIVSWEVEKVLRAMQPTEIIEIQTWLSQNGINNSKTIASGNRSVSIGGNATDTIINTGDDNVV